MSEVRERAAEIIARLGTARVVVVGDVMLDEYVYGDARRLSPEAPVPVVHVSSELDCLGGAANVAKNLADLGAKVALVAACGDDSAGERLRTAIEAAGIPASGLVVEPGRQTGVKTRIVCRGQQVVRVDRETVAPVREATAAELVARLASAAADADAVIFSDYGKGVLDEPHREALVAVIPAHVYTCVDPMPYRIRGYSGVRAATPNDREAREALNLSPFVRIDDRDLARRAYEAFGFPELFLTLGERGIVWIDAAQEPHLIPTRARQVYDVSGAGDTVVALLGALRGLGYTPDVAAEVANHAAGLVVEKIGTATVTPPELLAQLRPNS